MRPFAYFLVTVVVSGCSRSHPATPWHEASKPEKAVAGGVKSPAQRPSMQFIVSAMAFSPDLKLLVTGIPTGKKSVIVWDIATGQPVRFFDVGGVIPDDIRFLAMLPDGKRLLCGTAHAVLTQYELTTGKVIYDGELYGGKGKEGHLHRAVLSKDGDRLLTYGSEKGYGWRLKLWDTKTGKLLRRFEECNAHVSGLALSGNQKLALTGTGLDEKDKMGVRVWDVDTGELLQMLKGVDGWLDALAFAPDDKAALLVRAKDRKVYLVDWATDGGKAKAEYLWPEYPLAGRFVANGREIVAATSHDLTVRDRLLGKQLWSIPLASANDSPLRAVAFSEDARRFAAAYGFLVESGAGMRPGDQWLFTGRSIQITIEVWDIANRRLVNRWFDRRRPEG